MVEQSFGSILSKDPSFELLSGFPLLRTPLLGVPNLNMEVPTAKGSPFYPVTG